MKKSDIPMLFRWKDLLGLGVLCLGLVLATSQSKQRQHLKDLQVDRQKRIGIPFLEDLVPSPLNQNKDNFVSIHESTHSLNIPRKADQLIKVSHLNK